MRKKGNDSIMIRAIPLGGGSLSYFHYYAAVFTLNGKEQEIKNESKNIQKCLGNVVLDGITALGTSNPPKRLEVIMEGDFSEIDKRRIKTAFDIYSSSTRTKVSYHSRSIEPYLKEQERLAKEESDKRDAEAFVDRFL